MLAGIWQVAVRDFNAVVRTKGFVIGLLFMPAVMGASVLLPRLLARFGEQGERRYAVADFTGRLANPIAEKVAARNAEPGRRLTVALEHVDVAARGGDAGGFATARAELQSGLVDRIRARELYGFVILGPRVLDLAGAPERGAALRGEEAGVAYGAVSLTTGDLKNVLRDAVVDVVRETRLAEQGVDPALMRRIYERPAFDEFVVSRRADGEGAVKSSTAQESFVAMGLVILLLMGVMQSAGILLTSTIEEKSNRVVEVLMSSISPFQLLAGKVVGAWLTGLVMLIAWGGGAAFTADHFGVLRAEVISAGNVAWFVFFFLTGYLLFAALYASIGAMCSSIQDAQNMMLPVIVLIMIPMFAMAHVLEHPDSSLSIGMSWFPFSAPFVAPMRLALSPPAPQWQVAVAAAIVVVSAVFLMWLGGKIFRTAILMTGKPPRPSEIWRMLREA